MANITETEIDRLLAFTPDDNLARKKVSIDLGKVDESARLRYEILPYQLRAVRVPGRPLVFKWTEQPVIALEKDGQLFPLPYAEDLNGVGDLAENVLNRLAAINQRQTAA